MKNMPTLGLGIWLSSIRQIAKASACYVTSHLC